MVAQGGMGADPLLSVCVLDMHVPLLEQEQQAGP